MRNVENSRRRRLLPGPRVLLVRTLWLGHVCTRAWPDPVYLCCSPPWKAETSLEGHVSNSSTLVGPTFFDLVPQQQQLRDRFADPVFGRPGAGFGRFLGSFQTGILLGHLMVGFTFNVGHVHWQLGIILVWTSPALQSDAGWAGVLRNGFPGPWFQRHMPPVNSLASWNRPFNSFKSDPLAM